jgi:hypothetical protein
VAAGKGYVEPEDMFAEGDRRLAQIHMPGQIIKPQK